MTDLDACSRSSLYNTSKSPLFFFQSARQQIKKRPSHGIPLNVLPSEPKITMIADDQQYHPQDEPQNYQQYDQQDGFARQNSGSFHGYAVQDNMKYDDEPLVSDIFH